MSDNAVLRANNIDLATHRLDFSELKYISDKVQVPSAKMVRSDSLLICTASGSKSHLGKVAFVDQDYGYAFGGFMGQITPRKEVVPKFLFHAMTSQQYKQFITALSDGANINNLKFGDLGKFPIPVPPLPEQQRIVALLDEAFAGLATAQAHAERNLRNARALFESHLNAVFSQRGEGWVETCIGDAFGTSTGTTPPKATASYYGDFIPFVKPPELRDAPLEAATDNLSEAGSEVARTLPPKSILVSCIGNLGKIGLNIVPVAFNQQINAILPDCSKALPELMFYQCMANSFKAELEGLAGGTTVPIVNKSKFNSVRIVLPPLNEQPAIVAQLDALSSETQRLTRLYEQKLAALAALKQSLLHQAFSGAL